MLVNPDCYNLSSWHTQCEFVVFFDIANLLQYHPQFAAMLFQWSHAHCQHFLSRICRHCNFIALLPFSSCDFLCGFVLQLVETAMCFTICMIQCVFSILIFSFNWYCELAHLTKLKIIKTVIVVLLNGKMIVHKTEFKIRVIIYRSWRYQLGIVAYLRIYWSDIGQLTRNVEQKTSSFCLKRWSDVQLLSPARLANCQCYQCKFSHFTVSKSRSFLKRCLLFLV